jgi:hypothetical protein
MNDFINEEPEKEFNQEPEKNDLQKQNSSTKTSVDDISKKNEQKNHIIEIMHFDEELELYN